MGPSTSSEASSPQLEKRLKTEVLELLGPLHLPSKVSIVHCPGRQRETSAVAIGNNMGDREARRVASQTVFALTVTESKTEPTPPFLYTAQDLALMTKVEKEFDKDLRVWKTPAGKIILPQNEAGEMVKQMHQWTHLRVKKLVTTMRNTKVHVPELTRLVEAIIHACRPCQKRLFQQKKKQQRWWKKDPRRNLSTVRGA